MSKPSTPAEMLDSLGAKWSPAFSRPGPLKLTPGDPVTDLEEYTSRMEDWATRMRELTGQRDSLVRAALAAGVTKQEIHQRTGIARTTINRIVEGES